MAVTKVADARAVIRRKRDFIIIYFAGETPTILSSLPRRRTATRHRVRTPPQNPPELPSRGIHYSDNQQGSLTWSRCKLWTTPAPGPTYRHRGHMGAHLDSAIIIC